MGLLIFQNGAEPVSLSWFGGWDIEGPEAIVNAIKEKFPGLEKLKPTKRFTLEAT